MKVLLVGGVMHGESVYTNKTYLERSDYLRVIKLIPDENMWDVNMKTNPLSIEHEEYIYRIIKIWNRFGSEVVAYYGEDVEGYYLNSYKLYKELVLANLKKKELEKYEKFIASKV